MKKIPFRLVLMKKEFSLPEEVINQKVKDKWQEDYRSIKGLKLFVRVGNERPPASLIEFKVFTGDTSFDFVSQSFDYGGFFRINDRLFYYYGGRCGPGLIESLCIEKSFPLDTALKLMADRDLHEISLSGNNKKRVKVNYQSAQSGNQLIVLVDPITDLVTRVQGQSEIQGEQMAIYANQRFIRISVRPSFSEIVKCAKFLLEVFLDEARGKLIETAFEDYNGDQTSLENHLVEKIRNESSEIELSWSLGVDIQGVTSFRYEIDGKLIEATNLSLSDYLRIKQKDRLNLESLKRDKVIAIVDTTAVATSSIWECLEYYGMFQKQFVYLVDGRPRVSSDALENYLKKYIDALPRVDGMLPPVLYNESETEYCIRLGQTEKGIKVLDRANVSFGGGQSKVEICDIIKDEKLIFLKHLTDKKGTSKSSNVAHVLWQMEVSIDLNTKSPSFRNKAANSKEVAKRGVEIDESFFTGKKVVLGLISSKEGPLSSILPFPCIIRLWEFWRSMNSRGINLEICVIKKLSKPAVKRSVAERRSRKLIDL